MRTFLKILNVLTLTSIISYSVWRGPYIPAHTQLEVIQILITVAAIVFGVMGAWLAIIKIELIEGINKSNSESESKRQIDKARSLIYPMTTSSIILTASVTFIFLYFSLKTFNFPIEVIKQIRAVSFTIISILIYAQCVSLLTVLASGVEFVLGLTKLERTQTANRKRKGKY